MDISRSSWVAMRIMGAAHTNPVFAIVGGKPIRASRRSIQWLLDGVDQLWKQKERTYNKRELKDAIAAYAHARKTYKQRLGETETD